MSKNLRADNRKLVNVRIYASGTEIQGEIWFNAGDFSTGGMYLVSDFLLEEKTDLMLVFNIPGSSEAIKVDASVAWVNFNFEKNELNKQPGMGIKFLNVTSEIKTKIDNYLITLK